MARVTERTGSHAPSVFTIRISREMTGVFLLSFLAGMCTCRLLRAVLREGLFVE